MSGEGGFYHQKTLNTVGDPADGRENLGGKTQRESSSSFLQHLVRRKGERGTLFSKKRKIFTFIGRGYPFPREKRKKGKGRGPPTPLQWGRGNQQKKHSSPPRNRQRPRETVRPKQRKKTKRAGTTTPQQTRKENSTTGLSGRGTKARPPTHRGETDPHGKENLLYPYPGEGACPREKRKVFNTETLSSSPGKGGGSYQQLHSEKSGGGRPKGVRASPLRRSPVG